MGNEELTQLSEEHKDGTTSGSGSSSVEEEHVETSAEDHSHPEKEVQKHSALTRKEIRFIRFQLGGLVFERGDRVFILARLPSYRDIHSLKVVIGWLQRIHQEEVIVYCRFGLGCVSKLAILAHCLSWTQDDVVQMKVKATMGRKLEELPMMKMILPVPDSLPARRDNPSYHSRQPSSSSSSLSPSRSTHPSHSHGFSRSRSWNGYREYKSHRQEQRAANSSNSPEQSGVERSQEVAVLPPQPNGLQGYSWISQVQPTYSPVILSYTPAQSVLVMMPYPSANQGQSQTFYTQPCVSYDYQNCFATYN